MASTIVIIVVAIVAIVGGFFLYKKYKRGQQEKQLQNFANPIPDVTSALGSDPSFLSPITKTAILGPG